MKDLVDYSPSSETLSLTDDFNFEDEDDEAKPEELDEEWDFEPKPGDSVWVKSKNTERETWVNKALFYSVRYHRNVRRFFAPLLGEIKPDTPHVRRLLKKAGCIDSEGQKAQMLSAGSVLLNVPASITVPSMSSASDMQSTSTEEEQSINPRLVRFDERCVLIPEGTPKHARQQPRIGTFDVPIPLGLPWRWPGISPAKDKEPGDQGAKIGDAEPPKSNITLKVPFPIFRRRSHSSVQQIVSPLPPCLVQRHESSVPHILLPDQSSSEITLPSSSKSLPGQSLEQERRRIKRSTSLPPYPQDIIVETVPLRACCTQCISACETRAYLPPLKESSREQSSFGSPDRRSRRNIYEGAKGEEEDWCAGLHFTKGALRLRRSASTEHGSHGERESASLLGALVSVDEVDLKRSTSPSSSPRTSLYGGKANLAALNTKDLDRIKVKKESGSPNGDSEEDLFPLPSPKRSPAVSPSDSATYLPALGNSTEPRNLEAAIKAKMATREREREREWAKSSAAVPITKAQMHTGVAVSHFQPRVDEIVYDPSLPDPDALPSGSTILLNSPPRSPPLSLRSAHFPSSSPPTFTSVPASALSTSITMPIVPMASSSTSNSPPSVVQFPPHTARRRPSVTQILRAGVGALRGISIGAQAGQGTASISTYSAYSGRMIV
ncbi:hypothetical protein EW145_g5516 [Phellinidium pouzarii]|uniref:Uncharacterized protein n=1 Tax=Phellinidium pouzarii TaxID=167371 RepID=A0A4S4KZP5_9AGAM|nr:hypothetical protein EW145_g5516 [Phellinidium pouzarii]